MTYHHTVPQEHLGGRVHDVPQGNVLGGGSSVNAQVYMRGRPSDYDEWDAILRGNNEGAPWDWPTVLAHFKRIEGNNRLLNDLHGTDGPLLVSDPGHIDDVSRWFVQSVQAMGEPLTHRLQRPEPARRRLLPVHEPQRPPLQRRLRLRRAAEGRPPPHASGSAPASAGSRSRTAAPPASPGRDEKGQSHTARSRSDIVVTAGALITPKILMLSGLGPADHLREHGRAGRPRRARRRPEPDRPPRGAGHLGRQRPLRLLPPGRRLADADERHPLQGVRHRAGSISVGFEAGAFVNPIDRDAPPSIQAFCVPIVYLDRDLLKVFDDTYGVTITTVVVKPKSRGYVELRSANPDDMPLVSPHLLKDPDDMATMIARPALLPRGPAHRPARQAHREGDRARRPRPLRRGDGRPLPPLRQDQLPPGQHRPHGRRRRPHGRARRAHAGARHRQPPRRRHVGGARTSTPATPTRRR